MKLTSKLKIALKSLLSISLAEVETDKAVLVFDGELAEGIEVFVRDAEAEDGVKPAEDGVYETEKQIIEIADGKIVKITEKEEEQPAEEPAEEAAVENAEEQPADEPQEEPADEPEAANDEPSIEDRVAALEALAGEIRNALEQILNGVAGIEGRVEELERKVSKLDETPADQPADEEVVIEEGNHTKAYYLRKQK